ncbi:MAG: hypothetical protein WCH86_04375 [Kiritimatiellales bacterium]
MRITVCVTGIFLMVAAAVAQDDGMTAAVVAQDADMAAEEAGNAIATKIRALQKHVAIGSVRVKDVKNGKTNAKAKMVTIATEQDQDDPFVGTLRFTIEMTDGTNVWYGQEQLAQVKWTRITSKGEDTGRIDYTGEDTWTFKIPFGKGTEIVRPDVTAYAAEYGFVVSNKMANSKAISNQFVVVAAKCKEVAGGDEITARNQDSENVLTVRSTGRALKEGEGEDKEEGNKDDE